MFLKQTNKKTEVIGSGQKNKIANKQINRGCRLKQKKKWKIPRCGSPHEGLRLLGTAQTRGLHVVSIRKREGD